MIETPVEPVVLGRLNHRYVIPNLPEDSANHSVSYFVRANDSAQSPNSAFSDTVYFNVTSIEESKIRIFIL